MAIQEQIKIYCDDCDSEHEFDAMEIVNFSGSTLAIGIDHSELRDAGWLVSDDNQYCPDCAKKQLSRI